MNDNITVSIFVESRYKVNRKLIKTAVRETIIGQGLTRPVAVSVAVVGDRKMRALNKKYRDLDKTANVLSFSLTEGESSMTPSNVWQLGDVVLSYPQVVKEAGAKNVLVDEKVDELVRHSVLHLLGIHH